MVRGNGRGSCDLLRQGGRAGVLGVLVAACLASTAATSHTWANADGTVAGESAAAREADFDCDGLPDLAVADPDATVAGTAKAGRVHVLYGSGARDTVTQGGTWLPNATPETGDQFGFTIAVNDEDADGCSDLYAGSPYEDIGDVSDAGMVNVLFGSASGLAGGARQTYHQNQDRVPGFVEADDFYGYALAVDTAPNGTYTVATGAPGEDVLEAVDAGAVHYRAPGINVNVYQDQPGVGGTSEQNDRFGTSLAATSHFLAVGIPGEAIRDRTFAGNVLVFRRQITADGMPTQVSGFSEDSPNLGFGSAESGDRFGTALAIDEYKPEAGAPTTALLAVGTPNEDVGNVTDAGAVTTVSVDVAGGVKPENLVDRFDADVEGEPVAGDNFGQRVTLVNTAPGTVATPQSVKLAVAVPNDEIGAAENAGAVQVFPGLGTPGDGDRTLVRGDGLLPGAPGAREFTGMGLRSTVQDLYVGIPYSKSAEEPTGVVYTLSWADIEAGAGSARTLKPGADGVPAEDAKAFGWVIR